MANLEDFKGMSFDRENFSDFHGATARELAILIGSAYAQFEQQGEGTWSLPDGFNGVTELTHDRKKKVFGFVATKDEDAFIIIRGTRTAYEWYNNTAIKYDKYISVAGKKWGITTKGFYSIYLDIREEIEAVLATLSNAKHIFIAGHSLGGALATLIIPDLIDSGIDPNKIIVYTFASPRCCDRELATKLNYSGVQHWRIANTEDIIPTLPGSTANIFSIERPVSPEEVEENFIVKTYNDLKTRGMKTLEHTGNPIYFTIGTDSIQDNHNLEFVYMTGIGQDSASVPKKQLKQISKKMAEIVK
ncbi:lipase family protein [Chamaesiphon sp. OTE_8_metabat_110]|uniref:lipase family protein n=1 Tax=Chamaesiphon sp. OTE_8_metabat_110 TaxID=2964696 RepID=UPI00286AD12F|nr:lipase family protein [Chamaesiphon sp. OTE_8_metabat_110]